MVHDLSHEDKNALPRALCQEKFLGSRRDQSDVGLVLEHGADVLKELHAILQAFWVCVLAAEPNAGQNCWQMHADVINNVDDGGSFTKDLRVDRRRACVVDGQGQLGRMSAHIIWKPRHELDGWHGSASWANDHCECHQGKITTVANAGGVHDFLRQSGHFLQSLLCVIV